MTAAFGPCRLGVEAPAGWRSTCSLEQGLQRATPPPLLTTMGAGNQRLRQPGLWGGGTPVPRLLSLSSKAAAWVSGSAEHRKQAARRSFPLQSGASMAAAQASVHSMVQRRRLLSSATAAAAESELAHAAAVAAVPVPVPQAQDSRTMRGGRSTQPVPRADDTAICGVRGRQGEGDGNSGVRAPISASWGIVAPLNYPVKLAQQARHAQQGQQAQQEQHRRLDTSQPSRIGSPSEIATVLPAGAGISWDSSAARDAATVADVKSLVWSGDEEQLARLWQQVQDIQKGYYKRMAAHMLVSAVAARSPQRADLLLRAIMGLGLFEATNLRGLVELCAAYSKAAAPWKAWALIKVAHARGFYIPPVACEHMILGYGQGGRSIMPRMHGLLHFMSQVGVVPDQRLMRAMVTSYGKHNYFRPVVRVYKYIKDNAFLFGPLRPGVYANLCFAFAVMRKPGIAERVLRDAEAAGQGIAKLHLIVLKAYTEIAKVDNHVDHRMRTLMAEAHEGEAIQAAHPDAWNMLLVALGRQGQPDRVQEAMQEMYSLGIEPSAQDFTALLNAFAVLLDFDGAERTYQELCRLGLHIDHYIYLSLMRVALLTDRLGAFYEVSDDMCKAGFKVDSIPAFHTYHCEAAMKSWFASGRQPHMLAKAVESFDKIYGEVPLVKQPTRRRRGLELDLHGFNFWTGQIAILKVLGDLQQQSSIAESQCVDLHVVVGRGSRSSAAGYSPIRHTVTELLRNLGVPTRPNSNEGIIEVASFDLLALFRRLKPFGTRISAARMPEYLVNRDA